MADDGNLAASFPPAEAELIKHLWEACLEADWTSADSLCDDYARVKIKINTDHDEQQQQNGKRKEDNWSTWSTDASLSRTIETLPPNLRLHNPLLAAVLHVAIDVAASHGAFALFSDRVAEEVVDAEERKRRLHPATSLAGITGISAALDGDTPTTAEDFCPYLQMQKFGEQNNDNHKTIDDERRRMRRKVIAKLCRTNPLWILLPMVPTASRTSQKRAEGDSMDPNFDDDLPRGTTALHVAVRMRNVSLTKVLLKYCPKSAEIADADGCLPLHYAVRPSDETTVLRRAVVTYQRSLNGGADNAPLEVGPNEVHCGLDLCNHGKLVFKVTRLGSELARCRVKRMKGRHGMRMFRGAGRTTRQKECGNENGNNGKIQANHCGATMNNGATTSNDGSARNCDLQNMYETPSTLVRAMINLGTVEEDATDFVRTEWNLVQDGALGSLQYSQSPRDLETSPLILDAARTISRGIGRPTRPWKAEQHRTSIIKLLINAHPAGMLYQCDDGGSTPLILACQTLEGDDTGDGEDFGNLLEAAELGGDPIDAMDEMPERNEPIPDEIGEDAADYEMDLMPPEEAIMPHLPDRPDQNMEGGNDAQQSTIAQQSTETAPGNNDNEGGDVRDEEMEVNNGAEEPLEAVFYMIDKNGSNAVGIPDDDGDTALHAATRIGVSPRLVHRLLDTMPALASTPAEDGSTPLHLACRRACHLAPEGNGGMGTYDSPDIRRLADAAGPAALSAADDEGRTPFHVACRCRASPDVLAELADSEGGIDSLLIRDTGGHAPLGVYCHHATDYHGLAVLVNRCPDAAAAMGDCRRLPIHRVLATFNLAVNVDCLKLLGNAYPRGLDSVDALGMTPLALLCESYRGPLNVDIPKLKLGRTTLERCISNKIWLMAKYLILAARANRRWKAQTNTLESASPQQQTELIIHATLREPSSSIEIVQLATIIYGDQKQEKDVNGDLLLHICCRRRQAGAIKSTMDEEDACLDDDGSLVFQRVNEGVTIDEEPVNPEGENRGSISRSRPRKYNPYRDYLPILYYILKLDIAAAGRANNEGKYPLNLLIEKGATWRGGGVDKVLKASPQALFSYDLSNGLFAMALARTASYDSCRNPDRLREEQASCIGATFQLLRGKPTALESANLRKDGSVGIEAGGQQFKRVRKN